MLHAAAADKDAAIITYISGVQAAWLSQDTGCPLLCTVNAWHNEV